MAAELGLLSSTQVQRFAQFQQDQPPPFMWNPKQIPRDDDDSWEVKAFEKDSSNITWPPRSYTCTFCGREFRSAQALGGHMNVHRRERAQLHQSPSAGMNYNPTTTFLASPTFPIPPQEIVTNNGLCFVYSLPNPNGVLTPRKLNSGMKSPSNFASVPPFATNNPFPCCPPSFNSSISQPSKLSEPSSSEISETHNLDCSGSKKNSTVEELDLELRLGRR